MYRVDDIKTGLLHLVGWRQNYDISDYSIANSLTQSDSGQYFQDIHPLLTLDNIKAIAPDFKRVVLADWDIATNYNAGERIKYDDVDYRALTDNVGKQPDTNPTDWETFDAFSDWLETKTEAFILKAIQNFWIKEMAEKSARNLLESKVLFDGSGRIVDTIAADDNLVGFEIVVARAKGVTLKIDQIGTQFKGTGGFNLYLYHSSQPEPIKTIPITVGTSNRFKWTPQSELYLPYVSDAIDGGGSWYLVYDKSELPAGLEAINKNKDWSAKPCSGCGDSNQVAWSKWLEIHPFKVPDGSFVNGEMWDVEDNLYTSTTNYGLNLLVTVECDITDVIIEQKNSFQNLIALQVATEFIREFAMNAEYRIGRQQQNLQHNQLLYEIDGDTQSNRQGGLNWELSKARKGIALDMKGVSRICFPCNNGGIRYRTV